MEKPSSVIVYGHNKYLLEQSTQTHNACLSFASVHQMAPPLTEVGHPIAAYYSPIDPEGMKG